ncbi:RNA polymerase sigma factor [Aquimonas sp.]|jgi:RNA polymerase sigma-70 factor (ECF subfamily)|uniref:RNA polymerase sigma factor n=1 Tax=Aquimonas sp. TaxID=1872588 RepID=UPI0037BE2A5C
MHPQDLQLAKAVAQGDSSAFACFFDLYFPRLYRFLLRTCDADRILAEELTQAALVVALEALPKYRGEASLLTWLCTIARNELAREHRRLQRLQPPLEDTEMPGCDLPSSLSPGAPHEPMRTLAEAELSAGVHAVLDQLLPVHAECLELKYVLGFSVQEIAERLGRTEKAVEGLLSRARAEFRALFVLHRPEPDIEWSAADAQ